MKGSLARSRWLLAISVLENLFSSHLHAMLRSPAASCPLPFWHSPPSLPPGSWVFKVSAHSALVLQCQSHGGNLVKMVPHPELLLLALRL